MDRALENLPLSRQEDRVIALSMDGQGDKEIALTMGLSLGTVRTYWKRIQTKIGGTTRAEIVAIHARLAPERALAEERTVSAQLRAAEERFRAICACAPVGIYVSSPDGACLYVNPAWTRVTGLPASATLGQDWRALIHPEDYDGLVEWSRETLDHEAPQPREFRFLTPHGPLRVRGTHARMVVDGRFVGYVGTIENAERRSLADRRSAA